MSLQGLPDFHHPIQGDGFCIYFPFEAPGGAHPMILTPSGLELGCRADGSPDLSIEYVTGRDEKYGVLSFSVRPHYPNPDLALALARQTVPHATITRCCFTGGYLRLCVLGHLAELDPEASKGLTRPKPLGWNELESGKFKAVLSEGAITYIKEALLGSDAQIMPVTAYAEMEIFGVPPRLKVRATFDPAELLPALVPGYSEDNRTISRTALIQRFSEQLSSVPIRLEGELLSNAAQMELGQVLADCLRVRFGQFVPADQPSPQEDTCFRLPPPPEARRGRVIWDLEKPFRAPRPVVIKLHPLEEAQRFVKAKGLQAVFKTRIPELDTGVFKLTIRVNVPPAIPQIEAIGVEIYSPRSAYRPQPISEARELTGPEYKDTLTLRFSPRENKQYKYRCYAVLKEGRMLKTDDNGWDKVPFHTESDLDISVSDLPFKLIVVKADDALLREASVHGKCTWNEEGVEHSQDFSIHAADGKNATIVVPQPVAQNTKLLIEARKIGTDKKVCLQAEPAASTELGPYSFLEWGPHSVEVECRFTDYIREALVDFLPEGAPEHKAKRLTFDASRPKQKWKWTPDSMFMPGYRYRVQAVGADAEPSAWLTPQSLFERLIIDFKTRGESHD